MTCRLERQEMLVNPQKLSHPSLKITRHTSGRQANSFTFDVWSPFTGSYQVVDSIEDGLRRVNELAGLICQMAQRRHAGQAALADLPAVTTQERLHAGDAQWAEFRINPAADRSYDTRRIDRTGWLRATDQVRAAEMTCRAVGYPLARFAMSHMLAKREPDSPALA
jgi:hypothetical protein